jgi:hypothetical protein
MRAVRPAASPEPPPPRPVKVGRGPRRRALAQMAQVLAQVLDSCSPRC